MDRTMSSLTQDLGSFVADLSFDRIPSASCDIARTGIADCFGVLVAGARDPAIALIDREMGEGGGAPFASLSFRRPAQRRSRRIGQRRRRACS
jgi:2-methylcitrate dehydratase PrpD